MERTLAYPELPASRPDAQRAPKLLAKMFSFLSSFSSTLIRKFHRRKLLGGLYVATVETQHESTQPTNTTLDFACSFLLERLARTITRMQDYLQQMGLSILQSPASQLIQRRCRHPNLNTGRRDAGIRRSQLRRPKQGEWSSSRLRFRVQVSERS